jgi:uncharacterized YccA/Bax inhibitor family protein
MSDQMLNDQTFAPGGTMSRASASSRTMSFGGTMTKAAGLLALTIGFASYGWSQVGQQLDPTGVWWLLGYILLLALTIAGAGNPRIAMGAGILYAVVMGTWIGAMAYVYEAQYDGIVGQALLATVATALAVVLLGSLRRFQLSTRFVRTIYGAMLGILVLYLGSFVLALFGFEPSFWSEPTPLGIGISIVICLVAAGSLAVDVSMIVQGVRAQAPASMEWYAAFGLVSSLVWLYVEILRLLALLRR